MKILLLIIGIVLIVYAIGFHKKESDPETGAKPFYFLSYWKNLTFKGTLIYTIGLILIVTAVLIK